MVYTEEVFLHADGDPMATYAVDHLVPIGRARARRVANRKDQQIMATVNTVFDVILIVAAIWMVIVVRGLGGIIGRGLNWITIGALILGIAHLLDTLLRLVKITDWDTPSYGFVHRIVVLARFVALIVRFQQIQTIKK